MAGKGMIITPKQLVQQWSTLPNKFAVNVFNFGTRAGELAQSVFLKSFYLRRFNSTGTFAWQPRRDHKTHPLLQETGTLAHSIVWKRSGSGNGSTVTVYTDPRTFGSSKRQYGRNFCYAAVHNAPSGTYQYGNTGVRSIQRQFMGHSTVLSDELRKLAIQIIFDGFPK